MNKNDDLVVKMLNEFFSRDEVPGSVKSVIEKAIRIELQQLHYNKPRTRGEIYEFIDAEARRQMIIENKTAED